jgi:hypothetical protein
MKATACSEAFKLCHRFSVKFDRASRLRLAIFCAGVRVRAPPIKLRRLIGKSGERPKMVSE